MSAAPDTDVLWFLPTHGDGRYLGTTHGAREVDLAYLRQIAQAADDLGYYGVLLPTGRSCEDSWVVASRRWHRSPSGCASSWPSGRACRRPPSPRGWRRRWTASPTAGC